jgi:hypothetical protein
VAIKKERKNERKNGQVSKEELGAKAHLKKEEEKKNKDSPCFPAIIFKSK